MSMPSGQAVALTSGRYRATVVEVGAGLRRLTRDGLDLVTPYREEEMCSGGRGQLLLPWPNRIADGRYEFAGATHQLPLSEPAKGNAIHGLTRWTRWTLVGQGPARARWGLRLPPQPGYPWSLDLSVDYVLDDEGLTVSITAVNTGDQPAPYAAGFHPYLTVGRRIDGCRLTIPADTVCASDERGLPGMAEPAGSLGVDFRVGRAIDDTVLDAAFGGLHHDSGRAVAELVDPETGRATRLWVDEAFRWLQVYTGEGQPDLERHAVAIEPMTSPPNAFVSGRDVVVLPPGGSHVASCGIG